jgi:predicted component of viral defense system (DUF524 family)
MRISCKKLLDLEMANFGETVYKSSQHKISCKYNGKFYQEIFVGYTSKQAKAQFKLMLLDNKVQPFNKILPKNF